MKRILYTLFAAFALCFMFVGCESKKEVEEERIEIGVILPTEDEPRWQQDKAQFEKLFASESLNGKIVFSNGQTEREKENVDMLIEKGAKVIIICPTDAEEAKNSIESAKLNGVKIICYDRLILNSDCVDYYVSFNSVEVGEKQASYLVDNRPAGVKSPLYIYTGASSDNNSFSFFEGAWNVLEPYLESGDFEIANSEKAKKYIGKKELTKEEMAEIISETTTNWDESVARNLARSNLASSTLKGNVCILAPNDPTARAIADTFSQDQNVTSYVITGQDAELTSIKYIIKGRQNMTVFKNTSTLAFDTVSMAKDIIKGGYVPTDAIYENGIKEVPGISTPVTVITKDNYYVELISSGYYQDEQVRD
ncbi:MAG: sugar-binding protein [Clostridia bacterium]|nr:sugar-binding protein [Clostridia bacterium]